MTDMETSIQTLMVVTFSLVGVVLMMFGVGVFADMVKWGQMDGNKFFHYAFGVIVLLVSLGLAALIVIAAFGIKVKVV